MTRILAAWLLASSAIAGDGGTLPREINAVDCSLCSTLDVSTDALDGTRVGGCRKNNCTAVAAPGVGDDSGDGYEVGSFWINTTTDKLYTLADSTLGAAVWRESISSSTTIPFDYLATSVTGTTWTAVSDAWVFTGSQTASANFCVRWASVGAGCGGAVNAEARIQNLTAGTTVLTITTSAVAAFAAKQTCSDPAETMPAATDLVEVQFRYSAACVDSLIPGGNMGWSIVQ